MMHALGCEGYVVFGLGHNHEVTFDGTPCVFPFYHDGNEYHKCTNVAFDKYTFHPMCSTTKDAARDHDLKICYNVKGQLKLVVTL